MKDNYRVFSDNEIKPYLTGLMLLAPVVRRQNPSFVENRPQTSKTRQNGIY
jgi:hypothetical protein